VLDVQENPESISEKDEKGSRVDRVPNASMQRMSVTIIAAVWIPSTKDEPFCHEDIGPEGAH